MNTYNEGKHPRGQVGNAGQFRNKSWSDPEVDLGITTGQSADNRKTAREALGIYDSGTMSYNNSDTREHWTTVDKLAKSLRAILDEYVPVREAPVEPVLTPDAIAESIVLAKYLPYDDQTAEDVLWEALVDRAIDADDIMSLIRAGVTAAYESRVATPGGQVHSVTPTAPFRASNRYTLKAISPAGSSKP